MFSMVLNGKLEERDFGGYIADAVGGVELTQAISIAKDCMRAGRHVNVKIEIEVIDE